MEMSGKNNFPGRLFIVEGIDGSGKSTQLSLLHKWLESESYAVVFSEWNSSPLVKNVTRRERKKAADAADLQPDSRHRFCRSYGAPDHPAAQGRFSCSCRPLHIYSLCPGCGAGSAREWVRGLYRFAVKPTVGFYFRVGLGEAMSRLQAARAGIKFYEAGADVGLADDLEESFRIFQGRIIEEYERMVEEFGLVVIDASLSIEEQQTQMRKIVADALVGAKKTRRSHGSI